MNRLRLFTILGIILLTGCSQSVPSLLLCDGTLVVDYAADGSVSERLSVFAEAGSDLTRAQSLLVEHRESGLSWRIEASGGTLISVSGRNWFGSGYLYPPEGELIPAGNYTVSYTDLAGRSAQSTFFLDMSEGYTAPALTGAAETLSSLSSIPRTPPASIIVSDGSWKLSPYSGPMTQKYILIYTETGALAAMETPENVPAALDTLRRRYPDAAYLRLWMTDAHANAGNQPGRLPGILLPPVSVSAKTAAAQ